MCVRRSAFSSTVIACKARWAWNHIELFPVRAVHCPLNLHRNRVYQQWVCFSRFIRESAPEMRIFFVQEHVFQETCVQQHGDRLQGSMEMYPQRPVACQSRPLSFEPAPRQSLATVVLFSPVYSLIYPGYKHFVGSKTCVSGDLRSETQ